MDVNYPGLGLNMNARRAKKLNRLPEVGLCCHLESMTKIATTVKRQPGISQSPEMLDRIKGMFDD